MSTLSQTVRLTTARPSHPARRALLALAELLARIALERPDRAAAVGRAEAQASREREALRLLSLTPPLR